MNRKIITVIKKLLLGAAGGLGSLIVGSILSLIFFHASKFFEMQTLPLVAVISGTLILCIVAGMFYSRFFSHYFLCLLFAMMGGFEYGDAPFGPEGSWRSFIYPIAYLFGLVVFIYGVITFKSWIVGAGLFGITVFTIGVARIKSQSEQGAPSNGG
jgi:hypothetical protein